MGVARECIGPIGTVPIGWAACTIGRFVLNVTGEQRCQLLGVSDQIQVAAIHHRCVVRHVSIGSGFLCNPSGQLVHLVLPGTVCPAARQVAVDEQHRTAAFVRYVDEGRRLPADAIPGSEDGPNGCRDAAAVFHGVPSACRACGQPRIQEVFQGCGCNPAAFIEQKNLGINGLKYPLKMRLPVGIRQSIGEHVVRACPN